MLGARGMQEAGQAARDSKAHRGVFFYSFRGDRRQRCLQDWTCLGFRGPPGSQISQGLSCPHHCPHQPAPQGGEERPGLLVRIPRPQERVERGYGRGRGAQTSS